MNNDKIKVVSIFRTIDGEVTPGGPGQWSIFVRLGGCNLRCWKSSGFCDAPHSLDINYPHPEKDIDEIERNIRVLAHSKVSPINRVTITGGEPLMQKTNLIKLCRQLHSGFEISLETGGTIGLTRDEIYYFKSVIWDVKPPSTEMDHRMNWDMPGWLRHTDFIKCVISSKEDFLWFLERLDEVGEVYAQLAVSPRFGHVTPKQILEWIEQVGRFDIRLNMQMHKFIWPECEPPPVASLAEVDYEGLIAKEH